MCPSIDEAALGVHENLMIKKKTVYVCINKRGGRACIGPKSRDVFRALHKRAKERGGEVEVERIVCMGYCSQGPNVKIHGGPFFHEVAPDDIDVILDEVLSGKDARS